MRNTGNRVFWQNRVYRYIELHGPVARTFIARDFKVSENAATCVLKRLVKKGAIVRLGTAKQSQYVVAGRIPEDMRGTAVNSLEALRGSWSFPMPEDGHCRETGSNSGVGGVVSKGTAAPPPIPSLGALLMPRR